MTPIHHHARTRRRRGLIRRLLLVFTIAWFAEANGQSFRFAWLSDTHVGSTTGEDDLRASVRDINGMHGLSFVLISGDVTEYGSLDQLTLAKRILDSLTIPYHVIPGNHDTKWSASGATDFPRLWGADRFVFDARGIRFIGMHEGPLMKMGDGHFAPQDVRWLDSVLTHLPSRTLPVIFVTHYPLDDQIANWYEVLDRLKKVNTQVALVGHGHANHTYTWEGIPGIMGRSNLRARDSVGGYTLVDVRSDSIIFSQRNPGVGTRTPWAAVPRHTGIRPADTTHAPRPDFSVNDVFPRSSTLWQVSTGYTIASTPAVTRGLAIVGNASGAVQAFDLATGARRWTRQTGGAVYATPDVWGDCVVVPSTDGKVYGLHVTDGSILWRYATPRPIVASPRCVDGVAYLGSSDSVFYAISAVNGTLLWEFRGLHGFVETRPLVKDGLVLFGAWDEHFYALDQKTGALRWTWTGPMRGTLFSPAACWPVASDGKVFIVAPDREMTAIEESTGRQLWRTGQYQVRESIGMSGDGAEVYVRTMRDTIMAFAADSSVPSVLWATDVGFGYDINSAMLVERDGLVYYGTKNGLLVALDGLTGEVCWRHRVGVALLNTVVPVDRHRILVTDFDGRVTMLRTP